MRRRLFLLIPTALCAAAALPLASLAESPGGAGPAWATVNACTPWAVGVRARLPAATSDSESFVRFTLQWYSPGEGRWVPVEGQATSPWLPAGTEGQLFAQAGWTFDIEAPPPGTSFKLRGLAELKWRRGGSVVRRAKRVTTGGLAGVDEGWPLGTSLGVCALG